MAGLYIHIPYCRQACHYCNFHFSTSLKSRSALVEALITEISLTKDFLPHQKLSSIYFGGGTPSILQPSEWDALWDAILRHYTLAEEAEITVEANPDDITPDWLVMLRQTPTNRLSIGIQSFHDNELQMMNRLHSAAEAIRSVEAAQNAGFHNISIDLMYGLPESTMESWESNLLQALQLRTTHISSYSLTVEPKTALAHFIQKGTLQMPAEEIAASQFLLLHNLLTNAGMEHYEISNFALPGFRAVHNSAYWNGTPYLGIGPGAHSYYSHSRQWNISHNQQYISSIQKGIVPAEKEILSIADRYNEWIMIQLRTEQGLALSYIASTFGDVLLQHIQRAAQPLLQTGQLTLQQDRLRIPIAHWYVADSIISELFVA